MDYSAPTVISALREITRDPMQTEVWHRLLMACFDQKDSDSFASYQLIIEAIEQMQNSGHIKPQTFTEEDPEAKGLPRGLYGLLVQLSRTPNNEDYLAAIGTFLLDEFTLEPIAARLFNRSLYFNPDQSDARDYNDRKKSAAGNKQAGQPSLESSPVKQIVSTAPRPQKQSISRLVRKTSRITAQLVSEAGIDTSAEPSSAKYKIKPKADGKPVEINDTIPTPVSTKKTDDNAAIPKGFESFASSWDNCLKFAWQSLPEDAIKMAEQAESKLPDDKSRAMAWAFLAFTLHQKGNRHEAMSGYDKALALDPELSVIRYYQASAFQEIGELDLAMDAYEKLLRADPDNALAHLNLGVIYYTEQDLEQALAEFKNATTLQPDSTVAWNHLATVLFELGFEEDGKRAIDRVLELDPSLPQANFQIGLMELQAEHYEVAENFFKKALASDPGYTAATCYLALSYLRRDLPEQALDLCSHLNAKPEDAELVASTWIELSDALSLQQKNIEALDLCRRACDLNQNVWQYLFRLALLHKALGEHDEARIALEKAAKLDGADYSCLMECALAHYRAKMFAHAADYFAKASLTDTTDAESVYNQAVCLEKLTQSNDAIEAYQKALQCNPDHYGCLINLSLLLSQCKQYELAAPIFKRLTELRPDYTQAWISLGTCHLNSGNFEAAALSLEEALRLAPDNNDGIDLLKYVYNKLNRDDESRSPSPT